MHVDIVPSGAVGLEMMRDLHELNDQLHGAGLDAVGVPVTVPGVKDGGLTIAIAIGGLLVSAVSSLVSTLTYWSSQKPRYTITVQAGPETLAVSQLDKTGVQAAVGRLRALEGASNMVVRITKI